jgi:hypothetical protein
MMILLRHDDLAQYDPLKDHRTLAVTNTETI